MLEMQLMDRIEEIDFLGEPLFSQHIISEEVYVETVSPESAAHQALLMIDRSLDNGYSPQKDELKKVEQDLITLGHRVWGYPSETLLLIVNGFTNKPRLKNQIDEEECAIIEGSINEIKCKLVILLETIDIFYLATIASYYGVVLEPGSLEKLNEYKDILPNIIAHETVKAFLDLLGSNAK